MQQHGSVIAKSDERESAHAATAREKKKKRKFKQRDSSSPSSLLRPWCRDAQLGNTQEQLHMHIPAGQMLKFFPPLLCILICNTQQKDIQILLFPSTVCDVFALQTPSSVLALCICVNPLSAKHVSSRDSILASPAKLSGLFCLFLGRFVL